MPRADDEPRPKSKRQRSQFKRTETIKSFLGDISTEEESAQEGESFHSPDSEGQTDYGLDFTSSRSGSHRKSRQRTNPSAAREKYPRRDEKASQSSRAMRTTPQRAQKEQTREHSSAQGTRAGRKTPRKQLNPERRDRRFWQNVKKLQLRTDNLIPRGPFSRVIREILIEESTFAYRITLTGLIAIQEAAEIYLTTLFQDAYCCTLHRGRVTLAVKDIELIRYLRGPSRL